MQMNLKEALDKTADLIDYLTYCSYKANRERGMSQTDYEKVIGRSMNGYEWQYQHDKGVILSN